MDLFSLPLVAALLAVAVALWIAGFRLFLRADLRTRRKVLWTGFLIAVGVGVGVVLPLRDVWTRFLLIMAVLPVIAVADVLLLRSNRGVGYWIQACGFEVGTVFAVAAATRFGLDLVTNVVSRR